MWGLEELPLIRVWVNSGRIEPVRQSCLVIIFVRFVSLSVSQSVSLSVCLIFLSYVLTARATF